MEAWRNELYHFGILNMKWGVRRYQNPDGTLTSEGKKHYRQNADETFTKIPKFARSDKRGKTSTKELGKMTDEELIARANRLSLEKRVKDLEAGVFDAGSSSVASALASGGLKTISQAVPTVTFGLTSAVLQSAINSSNSDDHKKTLSSMKEAVPSSKNKW